MIFHDLFKQPSMHFLQYWLKIYEHVIVMSTKFHQYVESACCTVFEPTHESQPIQTKHSYLSKDFNRLLDIHFGYLLKIIWHKKSFVDDDYFFIVVKRCQV